MIAAVLLLVIQQLPPTVRCRLETGLEVPCGDSLAEAVKHPRALAKAAVAYGHDYDSDRRSLTLACTGAPSGTCHFRVEEGGVQRRVDVVVGRSIVVRRVGWSARLCADPRPNPSLCRGEPMTNDRRAPASSRRT